MGGRGPVSPFPLSAFPIANSVPRPLPLWISFRDKRTPMTFPQGSFPTSPDGSCLLNLPNGSSHTCQEDLEPCAHSRMSQRATDVGSQLDPNCRCRYITGSGSTSAIDFTHFECLEARRPFLSDGSPPSWMGHWMTLCVLSRFGDCRAGWTAPCPLSAPRTIPYSWHMPCWLVTCSGLPCAFGFRESRPPLSVQISPTPCLSLFSPCSCWNALERRVLFAGVRKVSPGSLTALLLYLPE